MWDLPAHPWGSGPRSCHKTAGRRSLEPSLKTVLAVVAGLIVIYVLLQIVGWITGVLAWALPLAVVLGVGYVVYKFVGGQKSLSGKRDRSLP